MAAGLLAVDLPRRWRHVQGVAAKAEAVAAALCLPREVLVSSAWLHDVGYAAPAARTGFHALDGGRYLRSEGVEDAVVNLVARHSCACVEAEERGLRGLLTDEFPVTDGPLADALWFCDMTTGPDGEDLDLAGRLSEARERYGPEHLISRYLERAEPELQAVISRVEQKLTHSPAPASTQRQLA